MSLMKKFLSYLLTVISVLTVAVSCVHDEAQIFDQSSSARMNKYLLDTRKVLTENTNGWVMYYYPNGPGASRGAQNIGGFVFTLKFTDEKVTIWSEEYLDGATSLYSMAADDGPVLNFNQFNEDFFYYATPAGSQPNIYGLSGGTYYQAHKGDINFNVMGFSPEKVTLRGKRSGNYYMMKNIFISSTIITFGEASLASADLNNRPASISKHRDSRVIIIASGIRLPFSHRATVERSTYIRSAKFFCESPFSARNFLSVSAKSAAIL